MEKLRSFHGRVLRAALKGSRQNKYNLCTYIPVSLFHGRTAGPISTKFCTDLHTNSMKVINTSMTPPTQTPDHRVSQTPKPKQIVGEKTLFNVKCSDTV